MRYEMLKTMVEATNTRLLHGIVDGHAAGGPIFVFPLRDDGPFSNRAPHDDLRLVRRVADCERINLAFDPALIMDAYDGYVADSLDEMLADGEFRLPYALCYLSCATGVEHFEVGVLAEQQDAQIVALLFASLAHVVGQPVLDDTGDRLYGLKRRGKLRAKHYLLDRVVIRQGDTVDGLLAALPQTAKPRDWPLGVYDHKIDGRGIRAEALMQQPAIAAFFTAMAEASMLAVRKGVLTLLVASALLSMHRAATLAQRARPSSGKAASASAEQPAAPAAPPPVVLPPDVVTEVQSRMKLKVAPLLEQFLLDRDNALSPRAAELIIMRSKPYREGLRRLRHANGTVGEHERRRHQRRQHYGQGRSQVRIVWIDRVVVNKGRPRKVQKTITLEAGPTGSEP